MPTVQSDRSEIDPVLLRILHRVGVDAGFLKAMSPLQTQHSEPQESTQDWLRLQQLRDAYRQWPTPAISHSVWTSEHVRSDLPLDRFRGDCAIVWQRRDLNVPVSYALTAMYLKSLGLADLLEKLGEDGAFGCYTVEFGGMSVSRDLLDSVCELAFLRKTIGLGASGGWNLFDIGSGYGRFAHRFVQAHPCSGTVLCADVIPETTFLCERYLKFRKAMGQALVVPLPEVQTALRDWKPKLALNIHSFSECTLQSIEWWTELLADNNVQYLFVVPNAGLVGGRELLSTEQNGRRLDFLPTLRNAGYKLAVAEPKYLDPLVQRFGVSPTWYYLFAR